MPAHPFAEALESRTFLAHGLSATYFDHADFTAAGHQRIDANVALDAPNHGWPAPGIKGNTYSVRWHGLVRPTSTATYTFHLGHSEGARLWVAGKPLVDSWAPGVRRSESGSIRLLKNRFYDIRVEYFDKLRDGFIALTWSTPTLSQRPIPTSKLTAYDTRFAAIGDYGYGNVIHGHTAKLVKSWAPEFIITAGDNNYPAGEASTIDAHVGQYYHEYIKPYKGIYGAGARINRFFPSLGNHDWNSTAGAKPYLDYFSVPRYYDFAWGPIHFFMLDSDEHEPDGTSARSKQAQWFKQKITASTSPFDVVVFHHPAYSSGDHGSSEYMRWPFKAWGADVVISGHDHNYERLIEDGLPYFVDGAASGARGMGTVIPGSIVRNDTYGGALLIEATDSIITFQYQLDGGEVLDTFTTDANAAQRA